MCIRSILGISVQFVDPSNFKNEIVSIGIVPIQGSHTAVNLKAEVEKIFEDYNISPVQVIGYTTDNGGNLIKTTLDLLEEQEKAMASEIYDEDEESEELENAFMYYHFNF